MHEKIVKSGRETTNFILIYIKELEDVEERRLTRGGASI